MKVVLRYISAMLSVLLFWGCASDGLAPAAAPVEEACLSGICVPGSVHLSHLQGLARSEGLCFAYFMAPCGNALADSLRMLDMRAAREAGLKAGLYWPVRSDHAIYRQFANYTAHAPRDSVELIPMLVVGRSQMRMSPRQTADSIRYMMELCREYYRVSPLLCVDAFVYSTVYLPYLRAWHALLLADADRLNPYRSVVYETPWQPRIPSLPMAEASIVHRRMPFSVSHPEQLQPVRCRIPLADLSPLERPYPRTLFFRDSTDVMPDMVDVSHHQFDINWPLFHEEGVRYAYVRSSLGDTVVDRCFRKNALLAREAGVRVGYYHYFTTAPVRVQAEHFFALLDSVEMDLKPMLDVESTRFNEWPHGRLADSVALFFRLCEERVGCRPVLYSSQNFYQRHLSPEFDHEILWLAKYMDTPPIADGRAQAAIWQYTYRGRYKAVRRNTVDQSKFHRDFNPDKLLIRK